MNKIAAACLVFVLTAVALIGLGLLLSLPVMLLWNYLLSGQDSIIGVALPALDIWRAWAMLVLTGILVRASSGSSSAK